MECKTCSLTEFQIIQRFLENDEEALRAFEEHGVIPTHRQCGNCGRLLSLRSDKRAFQCYRRVKIPKTKRDRRCDFYASQFKGTWLEKAKLSPSANILFVNAYLRKTFSHALCEQNLGLAPHTVVKWKGFCAEVCERWLREQKPIGGPGKVVEIADSIFGEKKLDGGITVDGVWVFGGIERETCRSFILPVEGCDAATLIPLCRKHILPGTTIHTDDWEAYQSLGDLDYVHKVCSLPSEAPDAKVHISNIVRLLTDIKTRVPRNKNHSYRQYLVRYLFLYGHPDHKTIFHDFLRQIARVYPPPS